MSTPPRITRAELRGSLHRIIARRLKIEDPHLEELATDPDQADPREVLDYLLRRSGPSVPRWVRQADVTDGLVLNVWLWWEDRRREAALLRAGVRLGLFATQLGAPLGITSRQGVPDRLARLEALLKYDRPDETLTREARRVDGEQDQRHRWVRDHQAELAAVAGNLLAAAARFEVTGEWLEELDADHSAGAWSPASLGVLGLAVAEVRTAPAVTELESTHNVHRAILAAEDLRARFAVC